MKLNKAQFVILVLTCCIVAVPGILHLGMMLVHLAQGAPGLPGDSLLSNAVNLPLALGAYLLFLLLAWLSRRMLAESIVNLLGASLSVAMEWLFILKVFTGWNPFGFRPDASFIHCPAFLYMGFVVTAVVVAVIALFQVVGGLLGRLVGLIVRR